jgi:hypothetical protein
MLTTWKQIHDIERSVVSALRFIPATDSGPPLTIGRSAYVSMIVETLVRLDESPLTVERQELLRQAFLLVDSLAVDVVETSIG